MTKSSRLLELIHHAGKLKTIKRTGWKEKNIPNPESVADHSFRVALMSMLLADELNIDALKLIQMSVIHDLAESIVGDITPNSGISVKEKQSLEKKAFNQLFKDYPGGDQFISLWEEYEEQKSKEAKILKNIDKLEMAIQAVEYQKKFPEKALTEFIEDARKHIDIDEIVSLFQQLIRDEGFG